MTTTTSRRSGRIAAINKNATNKASVSPKPQKATGGTKKKRAATASAAPPRKKVKQTGVGMADEPPTQVTAATSGPDPDASGPNPVLVPSGPDAGPGTNAVASSGSDSVASSEPHPVAASGPDAAAAMPIVTPNPTPVKAAPAARVRPNTAAGKKSGSHPVDPDIVLHGKNPSDFYVVQSSEGDWYDVVLNQCNISGNNNKYYRLQMLKETTTAKFHVWFKWGRVGEPGRAGASTWLGPFTSQNEALSPFSKKYRDKTGNKLFVDAFVPKNNKYVPIEIDNDVQVKEEFTASAGASKEEKVEYLPSTLDPKTRDLIEVLFSKEMRNEALTAFNLDLKRLPLGVPSQQQIQVGISILAEIENKLNGGDVGGSYADLSSRFYTAIPHSFGRTRPPVISSQESLQSRYDMCNILLDMYSTTETIRKIEQEAPVKKQVPYPADQHYLSLNANLSIVDKSTEDYKTINAYFAKTKAAHSKAQLLDVWSVDRRGEAGRFRTFDKVDNRRLLWHGTNIAVVAPIITNGLRIMPHSGGRVGSGIYLAALQEKSAQYTSGYGAKFACMFLAEAPLGKSYEVNRDGSHASSLKKAPSGYDSVHAVGAMQPKKWSNMNLDEKVVQVPQSKAEASGVDSTFQHDEFLVYDESQVRLRYILTVKL